MRVRGLVARPWDCTVCLALFGTFLSVEVMAPDIDPPLLTRASQSASESKGISPSTAWRPFVSKWKPTSPFAPPETPRHFCVCRKNGRHFIQSAVQSMLLIHPFTLTLTHQRPLTATQGTNRLVRSNRGLGVLLRDATTRPGRDRTGDPPTARRPLLPPELMSPLPTYQRTNGLFSTCQLRAPWNNSAFLKALSPFTRSFNYVLSRSGKQIAFGQRRRA